MTPDQKKILKTRAHALKPVVLLGQQGLTPAVLSEIQLALDTHELIKVKVPGVERDARKLMVSQIVLETLSELVQLMGQIATIYRRNPNPEKKNVSPSSLKKTQKKR